MSWTSYCITKIVVLKEHRSQEELLQTTAPSQQMQSAVGYTFRLQLGRKKINLGNSVGLGLSQSSTNGAL